MKIVDYGRGAPIVVVPGIQGRWEWHRPAIEALAARCRVLTFSFDDGPAGGSGSRVDAYCRQIDAVLEAAGLTRAAVCGISYGGLVAAAYAASRRDKVSSLILASALPPTWRPGGRISLYLRAPRLMTPLFIASSVRLFSEFRGASAGSMAAVRMAAAHGWNALTHMFSPTAMARRAATIGEHDLTPAVATITTPTLIIVGEPDRDLVVPVPLTLEYRKLVPHARIVTLACTGHLGCVTRPAEFAALVSDFAGTGRPAHDRPEEDRRVG